MTFQPITSRLDPYGLEAEIEFTWGGRRYLQPGLPFPAPDKPVVVSTPTGENALRALWDQAHK